MEKLNTLEALAQINENRKKKAIIDHRLEKYQKIAITKTVGQF